MNTGVCRGGPWSGKLLSHPEERFYAFKRDGRLISYTMPPEGPSGLPKDVQVGAYEYSGDGWEWTRDI